ncbi:phosphoribosylformylglycinamidine synthase subunit PurQ [Bosea sp. 117]|uniref:phosphoribosylformylglycinamidine synthase subunit PurQ n=1 Tax=Bosea sp. 117 TaxID=1125973 RepID=UPI00049404EA|nr:phosphoribosylformylglycinamidine synthase subunit PurQ [Bosea sp. 117]
MKSAVILFPGSNREGDVARAIAGICGTKPNIVWHADSELPPGTDLVVLPGGFSYGDYLRCGAIAARAGIMPAVHAHAAKGGLVLGICNGFQILCESGLLPGVLVRNARLRFICREALLRVERIDTPFTRRYAKNAIVRFPVAHGEGNYTADAETLRRLEGDGRVIFRYVTASGQRDDEQVLNGAANSIAGIASEKLNVLGLMPHPENHVDPLLGSTDGRPLFESLASVLERA